MHAPSNALALPPPRTRASGDSELLARALDGDEAALRILVPRLLRVIAARVRRAFAKRFAVSEEPNDLVQEVWIALLSQDGKALRAYDPDRGVSLEGFVGLISEREIATRLIASSAQKRGGRVRHEPIDERTSETGSGTPEQHVAGHELARRLVAHLEESLPPRGMLVFRYSFTDGLAAEEVAQILGINVQVVYNWQHKIRTISRSFLERQ